MEETLSEPDGAPRKRRALVVEQDHQRGRMVEIMLRRKGYRPERVASGVDALLFLRDNEVELIVAEVELPDMEGVALRRAVRRTGRNCRTALLGAPQDDQSDVADAVFPHPFSPAAQARFAADGAEVDPDGSD